MHLPLTFDGFSFRFKSFVLTVFPLNTPKGKIELMLDKYFLKVYNTNICLYIWGKKMGYNRLFEEKYSNVDLGNDTVLKMPKEEAGSYGFVVFENAEYMQDKRDKFGDTYCDERKYMYRKVTPRERREIVINTVIESRGRPFSIRRLAELLAVSDRTLQLLMKSLKDEGLIQASPRYGKNGARKSNSYRYTGAPCKFYGSGLDLNALYDLKHNSGFRDWSWCCMAFPHNKVWYDMYDACKLKFNARVARGRYLREHGLPLIVPTEVNFLVLRYSYWKGHNDVVYSLDPKRFEKYYQYSKDGTIKIPLYTGEKSRSIRFYGYTFELEFSGDKDNPTVEIYEQGQKLATFSWFTENIIERSKPVDEEHTEQFFILGDFTAR